LTNGPVYIQVQEILKKRIINEEYPIHTLIPSELELKDEVGVSKITIRRAVEELALQGYVEKRSGVGTTVLDNNAVSRLSKGQRFSEYLLDQGHDLRKQYLDISVVSTKDYPILKTIGEDCDCVQRLYTLNGDPYMHFSHYVPRNVNLPEDKNEVQSSLYSLMYQQGFKFSHFKDEFGVATPNQDILTALHLKKEQALLQRMRYTFDLDDQLIEFSVAYYHSEMHKYVVNFTM